MINKILKNKEFIKEKVLFNIIMLIVSSDDFECITDGENYLICRTRIDTPIWIWNKDNIDDDKRKEILSKLEVLLNNDMVMQITSKKEIFELLYEKYKSNLELDYFKDKDYQHMVAYQCLNPILNIPKMGYRERPTKEDIHLLALFHKHDIEDTLGNKILDKEAYEVAQKYIDNKNFYVWKINKRIVAQAGFIETDNMGRISMVFTNRSDRGNGYAKMLVYELCEEIISLGKIPLVYADFDYPSSNKAYQKIGFQSVGELYTIRVKPKEKL